LATTNGLGRNDSTDLCLHHISNVGWQVVPFIARCHASP
jgi:hypothetical protein